MSDEARIAELRRKLAASRGMPGYGDRMKALEAEIERLEGNGDPPA